MKVPGFTPSALPRLHRCLGGVVLPRADEVVAAMRRGTAIHSFLERLSSGMSRAESLALVEEEWVEDCKAVELGGLPPLESGRAEVGFLLDLDAGTARAMGEGATREAMREAAGPGEVPMVADWVAQHGESAGVVLDWKTGRAEELAPAKRNAQIRTYAAATLLAFGWESVRYGLIRTDGDRPRWDVAEMDWLEAQEVLAEVRALRDAARKALEAHKAEGRLPPLAVGPWCDWCPSARFCPARTQGVLAVLNGTAGAEVARAGAMTPSQAGEVYSRLMAAKEALESMLGDLKTLAKQVPLPLPSGKVLAEVETRKASPDVAGAVDYLRRLYGEDVAQAAVKHPPPTVTWDSLREALESRVLPERQQAWDERREGGKRRPTAGALLSQVRKGLDEVGATRVARVAKVCEVAPEDVQLPSGEAQ